jgi:tripartite ATP-independent transporter DctM subunit
MASQAPAARRPAPFLRTIDAWIGWVTEVPAAILVVVEVCILLADVIARYGFNRPLLWGDELAGSLFLWLSMLGAVIALRRGEHMRMSTLVNRMTPLWRGRVTTAAMLVVLIFAVTLLAPAYSYARNQWDILTPALQVHDSFRAAAMFVGFSLMALIALLRLIEGMSWREIAVTVAIFAALGAAFWLMRPVFNAIGNGSLAVFFVGLVGLCVFLGVPIAFSFGISTLSYLAFATHVPLSVVAGQMDQGMSSLELLAVPLFVLLGLLLEMSGIARVIVDFFAALVGHLRGGLSYVLFGAMFLISGISGSKAADQAAVAPVLFPEMKRRGADPGELVAQLASSAAMSETIPPSLVLIIIGSVTGVSITALFSGGLLPALLAAVALIVVTFFRSRGDAKPDVPPPQLNTILKTFGIALPGLILPFIIRAIVLGGIATATEVSTLGVLYTVLVGVFIYRTFKWERIFPMLLETAALSGAILLIIGAATSMAWALTQAGFASAIASAVTKTPGGVGGFMAISIVVFIVLGSVLEGIPAIVLFGPLLFPAARAIGINDVQYTMVVILSMGIGLFSPPFGVGFYQSCLIGRAEADKAIPRIFPYIAAVFVALVLVATFPAISLSLVAARK